VTEYLLDFSVILYERSVLASGGEGIWKINRMGVKRFFCHCEPRQT
jgi:hypothetical protein